MIPTQISKRTWSKFYTNHSTVGAGANQQLTAQPYDLKYGVYVRALSTNGNTVYVGDSNVSASNGFPLAAGEDIWIPCEDATTVYVIGGAAAQGYAFLII